MIDLGKGWLEPLAAWFAMACSRSSIHSSYREIAFSASLIPSIRSAWKWNMVDSRSPLGFVIALTFLEELWVDFHEELERIVHHPMNRSRMVSALAFGWYRGFTCSSVIWSFGTRTGRR